MSGLLPRYFNWVDALRGFAAIVVLFSHYHHFYLVDHTRRPELPDAETFPYGSLFAPLFDHGGLAVQLFWVISGFVFMHVYLNTETSFRKFAIARFARLYPLHFLTLILVAVLQVVNLSAFDKWQIYGNNDLKHFGLHLLMSSNWTTLNGGLTFNGPIWSVSLEMGAYVMFFLALPLLKRFGLASAALLFVACYAINGWSGYNVPLVRQSLFECAYYFFCGTLLYHVFARSISWPMLNLVIVAVLSLAAWRSGVAAQGQLPVLLAACAIVLATARLDVHFARVGTRLRPLGDISYSVYLVHVPIQIAFLTAVDAFAPGYRGMADSYWLLPAFIVISVLVAHLAYRHFELPTGRFIRSDYRHLSSRAGAK